MDADPTVPHREPHREPRRDARASRPDAVRRTETLPVAGLLATCAALAGLYVGAVRTERGQWWDHVGWWLLHRRSGVDGHHVGAVMRTVITPAHLVIALAVIAALAVLQRRRWAAVVAVVCAAGTFVSAEVLKAVLERPDLGIPWAVGNSFPSGHTGAVGALLVAAAVALTGWWRAVTVAMAGAATALTGVGVVVAGWHRPSDPLASVLLALAWILAGLVVLGRAQRPVRHPRQGW
ncbi:phosphatase PAP2 family protein [Arsenicicoccus dermatophilus]|uniref:phosphatase PAP2 family protein n=1 Tax=Arsenicicoccus dermatophilus TaxID=1076331 RepID=UPI0039175CD7